MQRIEPDDWERVRAIRLRALLDAPDAFATTFAEDESRPLGQWRTWLENIDAATFIATPDDRDVGLVFTFPYVGVDRAAGLFGMWVAPEHRGKGIAGDLIDAIVAWARARGYARVVLDVADTNLPAVRLYESKGFVRTGVVGTLSPTREHILEHQRELKL